MGVIEDVRRMERVDGAINYVWRHKEYIEKICPICCRLNDGTRFERNKSTPTPAHDPSQYLEPESEQYKECKHFHHLRCIEAYKKLKKKNSYHCVLCEYGMTLENFNICLPRLKGSLKVVYNIFEGRYDHPKVSYLEKDLVAGKRKEELNKMSPEERDMVLKIEKLERNYRQDLGYSKDFKITKEEYEEKELEYRKKMLARRYKRLFGGNILDDINNEDDYQRYKDECDERSREINRERREQEAREQQARREAEKHVMAGVCRHCNKICVGCRQTFKYSDLKTISFCYAHSRCATGRCYICQNEETYENRLYICRSCKDANRGPNSSKCLYCKKY